MALQNLKSEFVRRGVKQYKVAEYLGMSNSNFSKKLSEAIPVTREEMYAIRDEFCPGCSIDQLFESDGNVPSKAESLHAQVDAMGDQLRYANPEADGVEEIEGMFHELAREWERQYGEEE